MAASDILELSTAQDMLGVDGQVNGTMLATYVSSASALLDRLCGPVVERAVTDELHDGGAGTVRLHYPPVSSVSAVTEYAAGAATVLSEEDPDTLPVHGYLCDRKFGVLWRRRSGADSTFPAGRRNVKVSYTAGRFATTAAVDAKFRHACFQLLAHMWSGEQAAGSAMFGGEPAWLPGPGFAVPNRVRELLADELIIPAIA